MVHRVALGAGYDWYTDLPVPIIGSLCYTRVLRAGVGETRWVEKPVMKSCRPSFTAFGMVKISTIFLMTGNWLYVFTPNRPPPYETGASLGDWR